MDRNYTYYAFISYSHKDEKWAKWLQKMLESYRLPTVIRKESGNYLPKRIAPVFLDATDLPVSKLNERLKQELAASRYLIVICSPNSAKPNHEGKYYVNEEVSHFCALGREDNIIPVIIDGVPGDPEKECFCPKIHELGLVGLDATKHSRARILNDVVAKILSLRPDELWQREKRRIRRKRITVAFASCFFAALLIFGIGLAVDWYYPYTKYYADYVDQWGMPVGIFPLKKEQTLSRNSHYRFVYHKRDKLFGNRILREVIRCNSAGRPMESTETDLRFAGRPTKQEMIYSDQYDLLTINDYDKSGTFLEQRCFSGQDKGVVDFKKKRIDENEAVFGAFRKNDSNAELAGFTSPLAEMPETGKTAIKRWMIGRDESGYPKKIVFYRDDVALSPTSDADGCFGVRYEVDEFGRIRFQYFLDENGKDMTLKNGLASIEYKYEKENVSAVIKRDEKGNTIEKEVFYYDDNGNAVKEEFYHGEQLSFCKDGWAVREYRYDKHGFPTEMSFWGIDGKPCFSSLGIAKVVIQCSKQGTLEEESYFDNHDKPCMNKNGAAKTKVVMRNNEQGDVMEISFFDADGKLCLNRNGVARIVTQYDKCGNRREFSCFGTDGKLRMTGEGFAKKTWQYDARGNPREMAYYNEEGKLCLHRNGMAKFLIRYDERGNPEEIAFRGLNDEPCMGIMERCARCERKYDERGNLVEESYFNVNDKPCFSAFGAARIVRQYDEDGNLKEIAYYDVDNKLCLNKVFGFAKMKAVYNKRGLPTKIAFFNTKDEPCLNEDEIAGGDIQYDERGNLREIAFFGTNGEPCLNKKHGAAKIVNQYDERGNQTESVAFGVNMEPCQSKFGYAKKTMKYNDRNNMIETAFFDVNGESCLSWKRGIAKGVVQYDERGNKTEEAYFGTNGEPCLSRSRTSFLSDDSGKTELLLGVAKIVRKYDERGNALEAACFNVDGDPCLSSYGFSVLKMNYNAWGGTIQMSFWNTDNEPCLNKDGFAKVFFQYNTAGFPVRFYFFDEKDNPVFPQVLPFFLNSMIPTQPMGLNSMFQPESGGAMNPWPQI